MSENFSAVVHYCNVSADIWNDANLQSLSQHCRQIANFTAQEADDKACIKPDVPVRNQQVFHVVPQTLKRRERISAWLDPAEDGEVKLQLSHGSNTLQSHQKQAQGLAQDTAVGVKVGI